MIPIEKMRDRIRIAKEDSDTAMFFSLLYLGEMIIKITAAGLIAGIDDDRERHRYRQEYSLVRADGIGTWTTVIDDILSGPTAQNLVDQARVEQREMTSKNAQGSWQYDAVSLIHKCASLLDEDFEKLPTKVDARRWFAIFNFIRNKTRGHGAVQPETCGNLCLPLEESIDLFISNFCIFKRPWAYLYRNLSGRYRITKLIQPSNEFDYLKTNKSLESNFLNGIYIYYDQPRFVSLIYSSPEANDFFFPNGSFTEKTFEVISYITDNKYGENSSPYLKPTSILPISETQGVGILDVQGKSFGNLPPVQKGYIDRNSLEEELYRSLIDDRHPIITLVGRGGIGKTWVALKVLHKVANEQKYNIIVWFSARDIDLLPHGPKLVTPHVLTARDIGNEYASLMNPNESRQAGFNSQEYFLQQLTKSDLSPILFVFDNFETARMPSELFGLIDTYIRIPNKVLITSRTREFKGDYPIEVPGMSEEESEELIRITSISLGIDGRITDKYKRELIQETGGHPYVMKVLLGEVAKAGKISKVERIVASMEDILSALFERTFTNLSPAATRVFLTLCGWHSTIPQLALEAVLLRSVNERMDVENAVEELRRSSFIEIAESEKDKELFISVPLVAYEFGKRKLTTSPMRSSIDSDLILLHAFGSTQQSDIQRGITPRIEKLFRYIAERINQGSDSVDNYLSMLQFIARRYPPAWLLLAKLFEESGNSEQSIETLKLFIESGDGDDKQKATVWENLSYLYEEKGDSVGVIHSLVEMCQLSGIAFPKVSNAVNKVNALFKEQYFVLDSDEKRNIAGRLAQVMESRIQEGDSVDCSRLAWLFIRLNNDRKALELADLGLSKDLDNYHCAKIKASITKLNAY